MGERITKAECARRLGVKAPSVYGAIARGRLPCESDGMMDWEKVEKSWKEWKSERSDTLKEDPKDSPNKTPKAKPKDIPKDKPKRSRPSEAIPEEYKVRKMDGAPTLVEAKRNTEVYKARLAQLDFEKKAGNLVEADKVEAAAFSAARMARNRLIILPEKLAPELAAEVDPHKIEIMLKREISQALEELSRGVKDGVE